jgi:glutaconate CoA-transferase subunit B
MSVSDPGSPASGAPAFTSREMMAIAAGRFVRDGDILFAGTGVALLAAGCAKRVHAPGAVVFVETGGIDPTLDEIPMAVADPRVMDGTCINAGIIEAFSYIASPRLHTIAFLGAAQIDRYGNLNSTCIGDYEHPAVRFSGSGGACDAASLASAFIVFMQHGRRKFVERLDYRTSPGWLEGGERRERAGFARGGPLAVVTDLCVLRFDETTHEMYLAERYPGVTDARVLENTGFPLDVSRAVDAVPPNAEELRILRDEVDPQRLILG